MIIEMALTLVSVLALVRFWRTGLFLLLGALAFLTALGLVTVAGWIIH
jgi:hypothetical protein